MIPLKYNLRNLKVRWVTTLMTVVAIGLVVWATVLAFGLTDGLEYALRVSGDPNDVIVMRKGSDAETSSNITDQTAREIENLPGIEKDDAGRPLCSAEFVTIVLKNRRNNGGTTNLIARGVTPIAQKLRPSFKIVEGRDFKVGVNEAITSRKMADRFENLAIGETLEINKTNFTIVGYFEAGGSATESEVWTDINDLTSAQKVQGAISISNFRATDRDTRDKLMTTLREDDQFKLKAITESDFFAEQMSAAVAIKVIGYFICAFLTFGAMFAAANTMYAAIANRSREIGTLRAIGFSRMSILTSLIFESIAICLLGGLLGCLLTVPLNGISTGTSMATFAETVFEFQFGPWLMARGIAMAGIMGLLGGLFPAIRAIRMPIVQALRKA